MTRAQTPFPRGSSPLALFTLIALTALSVLAPGCTAEKSPLDVTALSYQVAEAERAFARTMADRDHEAFTSFLADEAVFFTGDEPFRGRNAVAEGWKRFYESPDAPFSWEPEQVEVLSSGTLAFSTGPVFDAGGNKVAVFNSIWRLEKDGRWRVVFDKGCDACPPAS